MYNVHTRIENGKSIEKKAPINWSSNITVRCCQLAVEAYLRFTTSIKAKRLQFMQLLCLLYAVYIVYSHSVDSVLLIFVLTLLQSRTVHNSEKVQAQRYDN